MSRGELLRSIQALVDADSSAPPVVGLDDYFSENRQEDSIAPNQAGYGRPDLAALHEVFRTVQLRPDVQAVLVGIHGDWTEALQYPDIWPAAENVHIITSAKLAEVEKWVSGLTADGVTKGWPYGKHRLAPEPNKGFTVYSVCWD